MGLARIEYIQLFHWLKRVCFSNETRYLDTIKSIRLFEWKQTRIHLHIIYLYQIVYCSSLHFTSLHFTSMQWLIRQQNCLRKSTDEVMSIIKLSLEFLIKLFCRMLASKWASVLGWVAASERDEWRERVNTWEKCNIIHHSRVLYARPNHFCCVYTSHYYGRKLWWREILHRTNSSNESHLAWKICELWMIIVVKVQCFPPHFFPSPSRTRLDYVDNTFLWWTTFCCAIPNLWPLNAVLQTHPHFSLVSHKIL